MCIRDRDYVARQIRSHQISPSLLSGVLRIVWAAGRVEDAPSSLDERPVVAVVPYVMTDMTLRRFGISACTANPKGLPPSLTQHGSCWRSSTSSPLPFQDAPIPDVPLGGRESALARRHHHHVLNSRWSSAWAAEVARSAANSVLEAEDPHVLSRTAPALKAWYSPFQLPSGGGDGTMSEPLARRSDPTRPRTTPHPRRWGSLHAAQPVSYTHLTLPTKRIV